MKFIMSKKIFLFFFVFLFICLFGFSAPKAVFALSFDKKAESNVAVDISDGSNDGQIVNVKQAKGRKGLAARFSGKNSYIRFKHNKIFNWEKEFSLELWIKAKAWQKGKYQGIIATFQGTKDSQGWALYYAGYNDKLCFRVNLKTKIVILKENPPTPGKWHHLAITYRPGRLALYIDGNLRRTNPMIGTIENSDPLIIGKMYDKKSKWFFTGAIDEVKIYDKTLSPKTVFQHAKEFSSRTTKEQAVIDYPESLKVNISKEVPFSVTGDYLGSRAQVIYFKSDITRKKAAEMALQLKCAGINMAFPEGYRYLFAMKGDEKNWFNSPILSDYIQATKIVTEELHKQGIKVIAHLTGFCVLKQFHQQHLEWSMISMDDRKPSFFAGYKTYLMCPNNPHFTKFFLDVLKKVITETKIDGVMLEETSWFAWNNCGCDYCKKKFLKQTGYHFPKSTSTIWRNASSAQWRDWVNFRIKSIGEFRQKVKNTMDSVKPGMLYTGCLANELLRHQFNGLDVENAAVMGENILFYESEPSNPWSWRCNFVESKYYSGFHPSFQLQYSGSKSQKYFSWAFALTCGDMPWLWKTPMPRLWEYKWSNLLSAKECVTDVALVISSPTKNLYQNGNTKRYVNGYIGWGEALTEAHIAYDSIATTQLDAARLKKYSVVIMPNVALLSKKEANILHDYVKTGGTIIATYETSLYDETGVKRNNFALSDLIGVDYKKIISGNFVFLNKTGKSIKYNGKRIIKVQNRTAHNKCSTQSGAISITYNKFGKGNAVYFSFQPGTMYYMPKIGVGRLGNGGYWVDNRNINYKNLMLDAVKQYSKNIFKVEGAPENILINPLTFKKHGYGTVVHLLNCQGTKIIKGKVLIPDNFNYEFLNYPALKTAIKFIIPGIQANYAYMISPDFKKIVKLPIGKEGLIIVPALRRYAIIYIPGRKNILSDIVKPNDLVSVIPQATKFKFAKTSYKSIIKK